MGMSASQARLLSLTARLSDLELQAQSISNSKIRLADESSSASKAYSEALDKQKFTVFSGADANGKTYVDASAYNLTTYNAVSTTDKQRFIKDAAGQVLVMSNVGQAYDRAHGDLYSFLNSVVGYNHDPMVKDMMINMNLGYDQAKIDYYINVFNQIQSGGGYNAPGNDNMTDPAWLESQVKAGNVFLYVPEKQDDGTLQAVNVSWTSGDSSIQEKDDDKDVARTEAKYEATMADIQSKDKRFDLQLKEIDTEHQAITTEIDSVKNVIKKNIEKSFKIFDA